jgi:PIN domain nuclease of toxin-antitoxin system
MPYLLDTHSVLWALSNDPRLSKRAAETYESAEKGYFSVVTLWEIGIKLGLRRPDFELSSGWEQQIPSELTHLGFERLDIDAKDCLQVSRLPQHHKDPFDRMLIAQATRKNLNIVSKDEKFDAYGIERVW